jgi:hypothetical protein
MIQSRGAACQRSRHDQAPPCHLVNFFFSLGSIIETHDWERHDLTSPNLRRGSGIEPTPRVVLK